MKEYLETEEQMRNALFEKYGKVPKGDMGAYRYLRMRTGIDGEELDFDQRHSRYKVLCKILGFSNEGGLAGRDVDEF